MTYSTNVKPPMSTDSITTGTYQGWRFQSTLPQSEAEKLLHTVLTDKFQKTVDLKNNRHNLIRKVKNSKFGTLILKAPRRRDRSFYSRFLSFLRPGEAFRYFDSHITLLRLGFSCPQPLLSAEYRSRGVIVQSFFVYQYAEGTPPTVNDAELIANSLLSLHSHGYTRGDPKRDNFLLAPNQRSVIFIDFKLKKPKFFIRAQTLTEFAHLLHTLPQAIEYIPKENKQSLLFRCAYIYRKFLSALKRKKRTIKFRFKIK